VGEELENTANTELKKISTWATTTLDSLNNVNKHKYLTEEIRQKVHEMEIREWKMRFRWIKAHAGKAGMS